ncbi:hypothetical protein [Bittarella massiliensis (ex Durand et al. 2017)]|uniref:hypothetical protein n=1 Tax=Bittarella massiliensis (ex Durand et al. 2017) TaxID=1720313 RepID=UPI001AA1512D|nr:hypothetical protein [Bittarella massiliensis (ex Durand et al. 2017)]MBO1679190.1 hypothetical protein [Bittarella massiliensis (ex Durand et al. 2017)]
MKRVKSGADDYGDNNGVGNCIIGYLASGDQGKGVATTKAGNGTGTGYLDQAGLSVRTYSYSIDKYASGTNASNASVRPDYRLRVTGLSDGSRGSALTTY